MSNSVSYRMEPDSSSQQLSTLEHMCPPNKWSCEECTFFNDNKFKECEMCETERPNTHNNKKDSNDIGNESDIKMEENNFNKVKSKPKIKKTHNNGNTMIINKPKQMKSKSIPKKKKPCIHSNSNNKNKNKNNNERKKEENQEIKSSNYKEAFSELISLVTNSEPKYEYMTNKTFELKDLIASKYDKNEYRIEGESDIEHYFDSILEFVKRNGDNKAEVEIINKNKIIHQWQLLKQYTIESNDRVPKLIGQFGLKSLRKIYKGTVIGEYYGNYYLEHEFDAIYSNTHALQQINAYAFAELIEADVPVHLVEYYAFNEFNKNIGKKRKLFNENNNNNNNNSNNKKRKLNNGKEIISESKELCDNIKTVKQKFTIVIDGYGPHQKSRLIYMNDCREHLMYSEATMDDEKYRNIDLVTVNVNGWPHIFAIATKDIEKEKELLCDYGSNYIGVRQEQMLYENNMKDLKNKIDIICGKYDIKK